MILDRLMPALVLVDIQKAFFDSNYWGGDRNNPDAEQKAAKLLAYWRRNNFPIFHVQHCSTTAGSPLKEGTIGNEFQDIVKPSGDEVIIKKNVNSAFIGTDLKERLTKSGVTHLVICGLTTDHCVSTTTRMASNFGFTVFVVEDATATFKRLSYEGEILSAEQIHKISLSSLHHEFATIVTFDELFVD